MFAVICSNECDMVLLVATAFVTLAAVAADDTRTIRLVKPASAPPLLGTADDWYGRSQPAKASGAVSSRIVRAHPILFIRLAR